MLLRNLCWASKNSEPAVVEASQNPPGAAVRAKAARLRARNGRAARSGLGSWGLGFPPAIRLTVGPTS
jgi:hypothetical protein